MLSGSPRHVDLRQRIARELTMNVNMRGKPQMIVSDNGTEFTSNDHGVNCHYIVPGRPMQNGYIESFNGRMRASVSMRAWRGPKSHRMPHSATPKWVCSAKMMAFVPSFPTQDDLHWPTYGPRR
jgi:transposase InsO family protein